LACRELVELVTEYLEGGLSTEDRVRFEVHIAACDHCSAYLEQMRVTLRVVGHIDPDELEPEVERELLDAFREWKAGGR
jgi:anti-sigma factor RsiW